ncbi:EF-P 5-aminopentanol modification-associated protein YfmH [Caproiciproducens galactitolivorans]|uniref:EF-P 5-aminopentanol modification-associated protein YfmH n=1 Tax=Caproiciproducens galactitolivorans TaxID=642589 RepID=UPI00240A496F|nr:pitrilysin family protein [Caproiciproducens galactitolivorans]
MNIIKEIKSDRVGDRYYEVEHPSGLRIFVYPKENNNSTYAVFGTRYGSIDMCFKSSDDSEPNKVPAGIAHYLEHKLFESEDGDAFARFAKTGASANAYTSFDKTCYLFSCTENVYESLEILLDFVQSPYFTEQTVQKEQGIIGQEIRMYDDDPQWRVMFNLLRAMYHNHPVKIDIAGTVESIAQITPELLYKCYNTFYNLNNMVLCVAGNVEVNKVLELCDKMLKPSKHLSIDRIFENEPDEVVQSRIEQKLSVSTTIFQLGFKEKVGKNRVSAEEIAQTEILLELMASDSSPLFRRLLDAELINQSTFAYEYFEGPGYASVIFSGESKDPDAVADEIKKEAEKLRTQGIDPVAFERSKKAVYGRLISSFNSVDNIANTLASLAFTGHELFHYVDSVSQADIASVQARLNTQLRADSSVLSIVKPID